LFLGCGYGVNGARGQGKTRCNYEISFHRSPP
jgi:hypothetical protein